jgi:DNA repair protein RadC
MFMDEMKDYDREHFKAAFLNTKNRVIRVVTISIGSLNASIVHPREILKPAIAASAASIILVHNHPTGDPTPSREDIEFTTAFREVRRPDRHRVARSHRDRVRSFPEFKGSRVLLARARSFQCHCFPG